MPDERPQPRVLGAEKISSTLANPFLGSCVRSKHPLKKPRFQGLASDGVSLRWWARRSRAFRDECRKPQVGPKINTGYPQAEKFFLANAGRLV